MPQEYKDLKKLGDSLLNRSSKLSDMIAKLESEVAEKPEQSPEKKRVDRSWPLFQSLNWSILSLFPWPLATLPSWGRWRAWRTPFTSWKLSLSWSRLARRMCLNFSPIRLILGLPEKLSSILTDTFHMFFHWNLSIAGYDVVFLAIRVFSRTHSCEVDWKGGGPNQENHGGVTSQQLFRGTMNSNNQTWYFQVGNWYQNFFQ